MLYQLEQKQKIYQILWILCLVLETDIYFAWLGMKSIL